MLPVGTSAPGFTLLDQNRQPVTLGDFRGAKDVLLVFFPLAFTGICQGELDQLRDHLPDFENDDSAVLAISVGPAPTHKVWATESGFLFPVLSDFWPHGAVSQAYGVFNDDAGILVINVNHDFFDRFQFLTIFRLEQNTGTADGKFEAFAAHGFDQNAEL